MRVLRPERDGGAHPALGAISQIDPGSVQFEDVLHHPQAEPGALAAGRCREEVVECVREFVGGNSGAGVLHHDDDRFAQ